MNLIKIKKYLSHNYIYLEGIIYVIFTSLIIFSSIAGPIYIKFLPLVFVCGMIGNTIFKRPVITSVFGFLVSLCTIKLLGVYDIKNNLLYSIYVFICIFVGEVSGIFLNRLIKDKRKKVTKQYARNFTFCILATLIGITLNNYFNGNIYNYLSCKKVLERYIEENYNNLESVKIEGYKYVFDSHKYYSYFVSNIDRDNEKKYKFSVYSDNKVIDGYIETKIKEKNTKLKKIIDNTDISKYLGYELEGKYDSLEENIILKIKYKEDNNKIDMNTFAHEADNILNMVIDKNKDLNIVKLQLFLVNENKTIIGEINKEKFGDIQSYLEALEVEYLDF